jgi:Protein of unknown function (DUF805)
MLLSGHDRGGLKELFSVPGRAKGDRASERAVFEGRASRSEYWWFVLFIILAFSSGLSLAFFKGFFEGLFGIDFLTDTHVHALATGVGLLKWDHSSSSAPRGFCPAIPKAQIATAMIH